MPERIASAAYRLPPRIVDVLLHQRTCCQEMADKVRNDYGSTQSYLASLTTDLIVTADSPLLARFYKLYETVFTLEEEREPMEGFVAVLASNGDRAVQQKYGPLSERILIVRDRSGEVVGGANFILYAYDSAAADYGASCQLNFIMARSDLRGLGIGAYLLDAVEAELLSFAGKHGRNERCFLTIEQNNPARMTPEQIDSDALMSLIDPYERMEWWRRKGFRRLDLPYSQPPLQPGQPPCDYLDYLAKPVPSPDSLPPGLPSAIVGEHLRRFFNVSVGKFQVDMDACPQWIDLGRALSSSSEVAFV